jgi:hypothetical protein
VSAAHPGQAAAAHDPRDPLVVDHLPVLGQLGGDARDTVGAAGLPVNDAYRAGMMGKYLNGYLPASNLDGQDNYVPPGWNEWDVAGNGYPEFNYNLNENHKVVHYGDQPKDYLTDVLSGKASDFITSSASAHSPFFLEVATFASHAPYTPAPADANSFPGLTAPRGPAYDTLPTDPPTASLTSAGSTRPQNERSSPPPTATGSTR